MISYTPWDFRPFGKIFFPRNLLLIFASTITLAFSFPGPVEISLLAWVALVPLFFVLKRLKTGKEAVKYGFLFGILFFCLGVAWVFTTEPIQRVGWLILIATYALSQFAPFFLLVHWLTRKAPRFFLLHTILLWLIFDLFIREGIFRNPLLNLADTQYRVLALIQMADIGGTYLVALLILLVNATVFIAIERKGNLLRSNHIERFILGSTVVLFVFSLGYGTRRLHTYEFPPPAHESLDIVAVQPNFRYKEWGELDMSRRFERISRITRKSLKMHKAELILWPETVFPNLILGIAENKNRPSLHVLNNDAVERIVTFYEETGRVPLIFGTYLASPFSFTETAPFFYNSMVFLSDDTFRWYNKTKPLLIAETAPEEAIGISRRILSRFRISLGQKLEGEELVLFPLANLRFGSFICSESGITNIPRTLSLNGANFLVNPTDNSAMDNPWEVRQHSATNRFRAIENRRWVISVGTVGPTELIPPSGKPFRSLPFFEEGVLAESIPIDATPEATLFTRWGNVVIYLALLFILGECVAVALPRKNSTMK